MEVVVRHSGGHTPVGVMPDDTVANLTERAALAVGRGVVLVVQGVALYDGRKPVADTGITADEVVEVQEGLLDEQVEICKKRLDEDETLRALEESTKGAARVEDVVLHAIERRPEEIRYADPALRNDQAFLVKAVKLNPTVLKHIDDPNRDLVLEAVRVCGTALQYAGPYYTTDKGVVLEAVRSDGDALAYASPLLRGDLDVVLAAVKGSSAAIQHVYSPLQRNASVLYAAMLMR
eukprot:Sspe_Gene.101785::Locus_76413_Transcript_1_1_Confidence_1.000_Length_1011::g.101785::m.101785